MLLKNDLRQKTVMALYSQIRRKRRPHEYRRRSAIHFLRRCFRVIDDQMGNHHIFSLSGYDKDIFLKECCVGIYHLPGDYFLLKGVKVIIFLHSTH